MHLLRNRRDGNGSRFAMEIVAVILIILIACSFVLVAAHAVVWWIKAMIVLWCELKEEIRELLKWLER